MINKKKLIAFRKVLIQYKEAVSLGFDFIIKYIDIAKPETSRTNLKELKKQFNFVIDEIIKISE